MAVSEWDQRQLCSDGGCVGVIGPDGTCKVCGRAAQNWGDERKRGLIDPPDEDDSDDHDDDETLSADEDDDGEDEADDGEGEADDGEDEDDHDSEDDHDGVNGDARGLVFAAPPAAWGSRQLCPDGGCIGVIGLDGRCKVCGRSADRGVAVQPSVDIAAVAAEPVPPAPDLPGARAAESDGGAVRCADPACAGMTGSDGRCEACGKVTV